MITYTLSNYFDTRWKTMYDDGNPYLYIRKSYPNPFIKGLDIIIPQAGIYTSYVVRDLEKNVIFTSKCIPNFRNFREIHCNYRGTHIEMKEFTLVNKPVKFTYDNEDYFIKKTSPETCTITNYENEKLSHWAKNEGQVSFHILDESSKPIEELLIILSHALMHKI